MSPQVRELVRDDVVDERGSKCTSFQCSSTRTRPSRVWVQLPHCDVAFDSATSGAGTPIRARSAATRSRYSAERRAPHPLEHRFAQARRALEREPRHLQPLPGEPDTRPDRARERDVAAEEGEPGAFLPQERRARLAADLVEALRHPALLLADERLDLADRRPARRGGRDTALVDDDPDRPAARAPKPVRHDTPGKLHMPQPPGRRLRRPSQVAAARFGEERQFELRRHFKRPRLALARPWRRGPGRGGRLADRVLHEARESSRPAIRGSPRAASTAPSRLRSTPRRGASLFGGAPGPLDRRADHAPSPCRGACRKALRGHRAPALCATGSTGVPVACRERGAAEPVVAALARRDARAFRENHDPEALAEALCAPVPIRRCIARDVPRRRGRSRSGSSAPAPSRRTGPTAARA